MIVNIDFIPLLKDQQKLFFLFLFFKVLPLAEEMLSPMEHHLILPARAEGVKSPFPEHRESSWRAALTEGRGDQLPPEAWWRLLRSTSFLGDVYASKLSNTETQAWGPVAYSKRVHICQSETS